MTLWASIAAAAIVFGIIGLVCGFAFVGINVWIYMQNPKGPDSPP